MTRGWLLRLPAWGERCYSQWSHGAEKVGDETKMCLFMPTGVLTLLRAAIPFCRERELTGHSPDMKASTSIHPVLLLLILGHALIPSRCWKRKQSHRGSFRKKRSAFCPFKVNMEMPECTQPTSLPAQRGRSYRVQSESGD